MTDVKEFERFYTRDVFNKSLNHFQSVLSTIENFEKYDNIADILNSMLQEGVIEQHQLLPAVNALLVDKYGYLAKSINIKTTITELEKISEEISRWNGIDIVFGYHNPNIGFLLINPKRKESLETTTELKKNELLTIYAGDYLTKSCMKYADKVIEEIIKLIEGKKPKVPQPVLNGKYKVKTLQVKQAKESSAKKQKKTPVRKQTQTAAKGSVPDKQPVTMTMEERREPAPAPTGAVRMTPLYSVPVTNELFHNGNVEAWKRIINSYKATYPGLDVIIFYEGERIHDINTLFKWGKVKHGCSILFAVSGRDIRDVAKLQRYLRQGASQRFEDFLKFPVNAIPKLF